MFRADGAAEKSANVTSNGVELALEQEVTTVKRGHSDISVYGLKSRIEQDGPIAVLMPCAVSFVWLIIACSGR